MKKKILAVAAALAMLFCNGAVLSGCGEVGGTSSTGGGETSSSSTVEFSAPKITLSYDSVIIAKGEDYDLLDGVTVSDEYDGDKIGVTVKSNGGFDKNKAGVYTIEYESKNSKGKTSTETRTVTVADYQAPALGWAQAGSVRFALPELSDALSGADLTVEYKPAAEETYTEIEKTGDDYTAELTAGEYDVRYNVKKDKFDKTVTTKLNIYTAEISEVELLEAGTELSLSAPILSENVKDAAVKYYYKAEAGEYQEIMADEEDGGYRVKLEAGTYKVKYEIGLTSTEKAELVYDLTVVNARLADTTTDSVKAGKVTLRKPNVSSDVSYTVSSREAIVDAEEQTLTAENGDYAVTVSAGSAYTVTYKYFYKDSETAFRTDYYMVYCKAEGIVFDFEPVAESDYVSGAGAWYSNNGQEMIGQDMALSGENSLKLHLYTMTNWWGCKGMNYTVGENVNAVSFFLYSDSDFTSTFALWTETDAGALYSNDAVVLKKGWNKYTLHFDKTFNTLKTYTFYLKTQDKGDVQKFVHIDDMHFFADTQA